MTIELKKRSLEERVDLLTFEYAALKVRLGRAESELAKLQKQNITLVTKPRSDEE